MPPTLTDVLSLDLPAFVIGIGFHEFCHAFAADRLGDPTPREQGRVTLNPIEHLDLMGTLLPLYLSLTGASFGFGWGKPVMVNPKAFRDPVAGYGIVAIAGPLGNLFLVLLVGLFLRFTLEIPALLKLLTTPSGNFFYRLLGRIFVMNMGLFLFNLLPVPPLDGSKVLMWLGGEKVREKMELIQPYSLIIFLFIIMSRIDSYLLGPLFVHGTVTITGGMARYVFYPALLIADFL
jgi:Zn-dependent protease